MITFSKLGSYGRLGNQIFQFSCLFSISKLKKCNFCIPVNTDLVQCFDLKKYESTNVNSYRVAESHFHFDSSFSERVNCNTDILGYFQSEKYFQTHKNELLKELKFNNVFEDDVNEYIKDKKEYTAIHVRRGDYVNSNGYVNLEKTWYVECLKKLNSDLPVIVVTDDKLYAKNIFKDFIISDMPSHYHDLCLLSKAKNIIMANSSFSWWGAYLSKADKVFTPSRWFKGSLSKLITSDLYIKEWNIV